MEYAVDCSFLWITLETYFYRENKYNVYYAPQEAGTSKVCY